MGNESKAHEGNEGYEGDESYESHEGHESEQNCQGEVCPWRRLQWQEGEDSDRPQAERLDEEQDRKNCLEKVFCSQQEALPGQQSTKVDQSHQSSTPSPQD